MEFVGKAFQIRKDDVSRELREEWNMISIPLKEAVEQIRIQNARDETKIEMARKLLASGVDLKIIAKSSDLPEDEIRSLI